jgi:DNA repair protein RadC
VLEKESCTNYPGEALIITGPGDAASIAVKCLLMHENSEEHMYMMCLNTKNRVVGVLEISRGTVNSSVVGVREIFQKALLANAVNIILLHNHPSGDPEPSVEDYLITEKVMEAGKVIGIGVLDHIVIGDTFVSIKERILTK